MTLDPQLTKEDKKQLLDMEKNVIREIDSEELSEDLSEDDTFSDDIEEDLASPPTSGPSTPKKKTP